MLRVWLGDISHPEERGVKKNTQAILFDTNLQYFDLLFLGVKTVKITVESFLLLKKTIGNIVQPIIIAKII